MSQPQILPLVVVFLILEAANVVINILPACRQTTETARRPYFIRAGIFNLVTIAGIVAYAVVHK